MAAKDDATDGFLFLFLTFGEQFCGGGNPPPHCFCVCAGIIGLRWRLLVCAGMIGVRKTVAPRSSGQASDEWRVASFGMKNGEI
jgi:hypothetical protein